MPVVEHTWVSLYLDCENKERRMGIKVSQEWDGASTQNMDSGQGEELPIDMVQGPPEPQGKVLKYLYDKALRTYKGVIPLRVGNLEGFGVPRYAPDKTTRMLIRTMESEIPDRYNMDIPKRLIAGMVERVDERDHVADLVDHNPQPTALDPDILIELQTETETHYTVIIYLTEVQLALLQSAETESTRPRVEFTGPRELLDHFWNILDLLDKHEPKSDYEENLSPCINLLNA